MKTLNMKTKQAVSKALNGFVKDEHLHGWNFNKNYANAFSLFANAMMENNAEEMLNNLSLATKKKALYALNVMIANIYLNRRWAKFEYKGRTFSMNSSELNCVGEFESTMRNEWNIKKYR